MTHVTKPKIGIRTARAKAEGAKTLIVEQTGGPARRPDIQQKTLIGLGLNKRHRRRVLLDTPEVRGMIASIPHLVRIVDEISEKK